MQLSAGAIVGDRYVVEEQLGKGGMANVWRVRHRTLGTRHALKVLYNTAPELRDRLVEEGRIQSQMRHPQIVRVTDVVDVVGGVGLIMELVEGPTLRALLREGRPPMSAVLSLGEMLLEGVAYAHQSGFIHRDLKPENILLQPRGDAYIVKIADFGLARALLQERRHTATGVALGTPGYIAPEQYKDAARADARSDVFSLGVILFEMVTGQPPFSGSDVITLFQQAQRSEFPEPATLTPDLPPLLSLLIEQALSPDPAERFASAGDFLAQWREAATEDGPAPSSPRGTPRRTRRFISYARQDRFIIEQAVYLWSAEPSGPLPVHHNQPWEPEPLRTRIAQADEVHVFWSRALRRSERGAQELAAARAAEKAVVLHRLDDAPLPDIRTARVLDASQDTRVVSAPVWLGLLVSAGWATWVLWPAPEGAAVVGPIWVPVSVGMVLLGIWLALLQQLRSVRRFLFARSLMALGRWLGRAQIKDILALAGEILDALFGHRLLSWKALRRSALASLLIFIPLSVSWGVGLEGESLSFGVIVSLVLTVLMLPVNIAADFLSLVITRTLIARLHQAPSPRRLALGLALEAALTASCGLLTLLLSPTMVIVAMLTETAWAWPVFALDHVWLLLSGRLHTATLLHAEITFFFVMSGLAALTAGLPSLIHLSLLSVALISRVRESIVLRLVGQGLSGWAQHSQGPLAGVYPFFAVLLVLLGVSSMSASVAPSEPSWSTAIAPQAASIPDPAGDGVPQAVETTAAYHLTRTEITQAWWASVWDRAPQRAAAWRLKRRPSAYRGVDQPVDNASWCDVARFANLWSLSEQRTPAYTIHTDPSLPGCEAGEPVAWDATARDAYRLPTAAEWHLAAWAGLPSTKAARQPSGWHFRTALGVPQRVAQLPPCTLGLYDMRGNLSEWVWDLASEGPPVERVLLGGAAGLGPGSTLIGAHDSRPQFVRAQNIGFRLARTAEAP